jgi:hypothetical protein
MSELIDRHRGRLHDLIEEWQLCGCGSDEGKWGVIQWVLEHTITYPPDDGRESFFDFLEKHPELKTWVEFAVQVVDKMGLLEHGGSWTGSWLEGFDDGIGAAMREFLREYGIDQDKWPAWALGDMGRTNGGAG